MISEGGKGCTEQRRNRSMEHGRSSTDTKKNVNPSANQKRQSRSHATNARNTKGEVDHDSTTSNSMMLSLKVLV